MAIELGYEPRPQFIPFHESTKRWSVVIAHRRSGKTYALLYQLIMSAIYVPNGRFGYCAPFYSQAKAIAFDYLLRFTQDIRKTVNVAELYVELFNGARIRLYGAGNQGGDQIRGQYFHGVVLDEYADMPQNLFNEVIRATLVDHSGFCVFAGTPKGHNHLYSVYKTAQQYPDLWYSQVLKASESGIVSDEELQAAKLQMDDYQYQQEFECNFDSAIQGAYYAQQLDEMVSDGRIANFSHDIYHCVHAALDIGITDATAITFFQYRDGRFDFLDYEEGNGQIAAYWAQLIEDRARKSGWKLGYVFLPHDARAKELTSGKSVLESFVEVIGINRAQIVQNHYVSDGINGVRMALMTARINEVKCERLIDVLRCYSHEWDSEKRIFKSSPRHDEYSHGADSLRYSIMGFNKKTHTDETKFFPYHQKEALRQAQAAIAQSQRKPPQDPRDLANYYSANVQRAYEKVRNSGCQDAQDYMDSYAMSEDEFCKIHGILPSHLHLLKVDPQ